MDNTENSKRLYFPKGYKGLMSSDYYVLWDLIKQGHKVAGWLLYTDKYDEPIHDIVEICIRNERYKIGVRGIGYEGIKQEMSEFVKVCSHYNLTYINPISAI